MSDISTDSGIPIKPVYRVEDALRLGARVGAASVAALGDYAGYPREPEIEDRG